MRQTPSGIYYLYDYYPVRSFDYCTQEQQDLSRQIWSYKDRNYEAYNRFTNDLMRAIAQLAQNFQSNKIGLVAVPPSKVNKASAVRDSINAMKVWYDEGTTKTVFNCSKEIIDYGNLLVRSVDIPTAHEGTRATYEQQKASITCTRDHLSQLWTTFIILDDVTTQGTSMEVCKDILIEHGAVARYIYQLAVAKTV